MTRLIDADNLSIRKFIIAGTFEPYAKGWNDAIDAIIDNEPTIPLPDFKEGYKQAIRDGKTNYSRPQEWIPVSERLPEAGQIVIVSDDRGKVFEYELDPLDVEWQFLKHKIIAWQPFPEPYKEVDNETDN